MDFEWDLQKADINDKKHGVSFDEASSVFGDYLSLANYLGWRRFLEKYSQPTPESLLKAALGDFQYLTVT